jgi:hypothetical protein
VKHLLTMRRPTAIAFVAVLAAGLVLPIFVWDGYLGIYAFLSRDKGDWVGGAVTAVMMLPFTLCLWYVETRLKFDLADRIGWSLVPFAMFAAFRQNAPRHLLIVLLIPDRRGVRNLAGGVALWLHYLLPRVVGLGGALAIAAALLILALVYYLRRIGWDLVRDDLRHPRRTMRMLLAG